MDAQTANAIWPWLPVGFLALMLLLYLERRQAVLCSRGVQVFRPMGTIRLLYWWMLAAGAGLMLGPALYLDTVEPWSGTAGMATIVIAVVTWPPSLYVTWNSLRSERWWGRGTEIAWEDVESVRYDYHAFSTVVTAVDGRVIRHTLIDCDPDGFQAQVVRRANVSVRWV